jgi:hypothetical protein
VSESKKIELRKRNFEKQEKEKKHEMKAKKERKAKKARSDSADHG